MALRRTEAVQCIHDIVETNGVHGQELYEKKKRNQQTMVTNNKLKDQEPGSRIMKMKQRQDYCGEEYGREL